MLRNLASSLFLTERDEVVDELGRDYLDFSTPNKPKVKGRIVTTLPKAKEARRLVERCITIAKKGIQAEENAEPPIPAKKMNKFLKAQANLQTAEQKYRAAMEERPPEGMTEKQDEKWAQAHRSRVTKAGKSVEKA